MARRAFSALFILSIYFVAFGGAPARATCQPDPIGGSPTVNCTAAGGPQTTMVGTGFEDNRTVTVQSGASIAVGPDAIGIFLGNQNLVTNFGTISAGDSSGGGPFGNTAGVFVTGDGNVVVNNGSITAGNVTSGQIFGINSFGIGANITNNNSIVVGNGSGGLTPDAFGISVYNSSQVTNNGTIITGNFSTGIFSCCDNTITNNAQGLIQSGDSSFGIFASDRNTVTNAGTIVVGNGTPSIPAFGILVGGQDNTVTNSGTIRAGTNAAGMGVDDSIFVLGGAPPVNLSGNTLINAAGGLIQVGNGSWGMVSGSVFPPFIVPPPTSITMINNGIIIAGDALPGTTPAVGILSFGPATITNSGIIAAGNGDFGSFTPVYGIFAAEDGSTIQNSGMISVGIFGTGIKAGGDNTTVTNSGMIVAGAGGTGIDISAPASGPAVGSGATVTNLSSIVAGAGGSGVRFNDSGTLNNFGLVHAFGDGTGLNGYSVFSCSCTTTNITNLGVLDGRIQMEGVSTTLVNRGVIQISDSVAVQPIRSIDPTFSPFQFSISDIAAGGGGSFEQKSEGLLSLRVVPGAPAPIDQLLADTVTLAGTLRVAIQPGLYANTTITDTAVSITHNPGGASNISTTFGSFISSSPFFVVTPIYNGLSATSTDYDLLTLQLDRIPFGSVPGATPNQTAVGNALEGPYSTNLTGNAATFYSNLLAATSIGALDQLSGEGMSAAQNAAFGAGSQFNGAMQNQGLFGSSLGGISVTIPATQYADSRVARGHEAFASLKTDPDVAQAGRWRLWSAGFAASHALQGEAATGSSNQSIRNFGGALGFDHQITPDLLVGFAAGGSESSFSVTNLSTSGRLTGGHLGLYAVKTWGAYYAAASLSYSRFDNSTTRQITGIGPSETASGRFGSDQLSGRLELGWKRATAFGTVTPFVAIEPAALWQQSYTESSVTAGGGSGILGLAVASHTATSLPTFVGVQFDTRQTLANGAIFSPFARVSWVHEFEPDRQVTAGFVTVPSAIFTVDGARAASDAARIDAGAKLALRGGHAMFANFTGEWSDRTQSYAGTAGFRTSW